MRFLMIMMLALGFLPQSALGALPFDKTIELHSDAEQVIINQFSYLADPLRGMNLENVRNKDGWSLNERPAFNFGFAKADYWITFRVRNNETVLRDWILELQYAPLDNVDLYVIHEDGRITEKKGGDRRPFSERDIAYRTTNFVISAAAGESLTFYLKLNSQSSIQGPLVLWTPTRFIEKASNELVGFALYVGLLLSMVVYNFFLFINIKDRSHLYYVLYVFFYGYTMVSLFGLTYQYITPESPIFANYAVPVSISFGCIFITLFAQDFLQLKQYSVRMVMLFRLFMALAVCALVSTVFSYSLGIKLAAGMTMAGAPVILAAGIVCLRKGYRPAYFFVLAFAAFLIGISITQFISFGIIEPGFITTYSAHFGSALEMLLLSIALGDKIKFEQLQSSQKIEHLNEQLQKEHDKIVSLNEHLEARVEEQTRDIRSMLANIRLGIFTVVDDGRIHKDYSAYLEQIFQRKDLEGLKAVEMLLESCNSDRDSLSQASSILQSTLGEPKLSFDLNEGSLIREITKTHADGSQQILELDWNPIVNRRDIIEKVLVTVRDVTQLRDLQQVANVKKKELEFIAEIVPVAREHFSRFVNSAEKHIEENQSLIAASSTKNMEALKIILINLHTIKGTARALGLKKLTEVVHGAEHYVGQLQAVQVDWDRARLQRDLDAVKETFSYYRHVNDTILERGSSRSSIELDMVKVEAVLHEITELHKQPLSPDSRSLFQKIDFMLSKAFHQPAEIVFTEIFAATQRLAKDLGKEPPKISIMDNGIFLTREGADLLRNVFSHLIRNSMDHGIESRDERQAAGKPLYGAIAVSLSEKKNEVELCYHDDGRGLALQMIKEIALIRGMLDSTGNVSQEDLAHFIFLPGFSTSHSVNEISGRGVGMSAIKSYTENAGGTLALKLLPDQNGMDAAYVPLNIIIRLPMHYYRSFPKSFMQGEIAA
ncbi:MAG TPA: 7TM diverse intracellular signaling domain-containing protein [Oligoflexus sp.]|uniref:7TM diverse intracellular signaling domain-containing protein n=1 Tax=Oligoflexus sp. TaxID=1971216 RepID=UPI002D37E962|nr:7TM diverse intracellular signaling domain-containing protein [Oligoflexus sp.]HYX37505.1 7TM diverse intracellular signaling domain-containing protein [Oligoflexus sp.]